MMDHNVKPLYSVGDLVITREPENRVWRVLGCHDNTLYEDGEYSQTIVYKIACVATNNSIESDQKNLILVCKKEFASEYVKLVNADGTAPQYPIAEIQPDTTPKAHQEEIRTPNRFRGSKEVDELLDRLIALTVAQEDLNINYQDDIFEIKCMLKWLQEEACQ